MSPKLSLRLSHALVALVAVFALTGATRGQGTLASAPSHASAPRSDVIDAAQLLRDVETLAADDMQGRKADTPGGARAREYVAARFRQAGVEQFGASYVQPFDFSYPHETVVHRGANVVGFIKGESRADRYLVVTAHYDHLGVMGGDIYHGADDNASGVAALLALAAYFNQHRPSHTIIFAAFDAEEGSGAGGRTFVEKPPVERGAIILDVNLDMVSHNDRNELYVAGAHYYPFLKTYLDSVAAHAPVHLIEGHDDPKLGHDDWTFQSDQGEFHRAGIPFVYFGVEDHKDYHKPTDVFANINQEFFVRAVETILSTVRTLDKNLDEFPSRVAFEKKGEPVKK